MVVVRPGAHEEADHLVPLLLQEPDRSRAIDSTTHRENDAHRINWDDDLGLTNRRF